MINTCKLRVREWQTATVPTERCNGAQHEAAMVYPRKWRLLRTASGDRATALRAHSVLA
eukprot:CAMPEP_0183501512 /NCGR_PEP_ID=MMETSP0371-20130417/3423_1 /TAXON_ID=268820 /ORGANISM="Peridinium aciculiferum, Strain PAER-2" /LENGTH=58 /DNA_ID=CAMNT_0025695915 /DNA_START=202 /DNA_END=375 /DNA_ORIENTATION=+